MPYKDRASITCRAETKKRVAAVVGRLYSKWTWDDLLQDYLKRLREKGGT